MPSLLDLSDDTIQHIASYANGDSDIPFPSFRPHWQNFRSSIAAKEGKDLIALRSTCRRLRMVVKLQGLHMRLTSWETMIKHLNNSPVELLHGVKRLEVNILRPVPGALVSSWTSFISFLSLLRNLEELVIINVSLCRHTHDAAPDQDCTFTHNLRLPPGHTQTLFSKLKAVSIACECRFCLLHYTHHPLGRPAPPVSTHLVYDPHNQSRHTWWLGEE
ncbi:hypothetical protein IAT38_003033 [Cryptococcus sp. DSM 104549]